MELGMHFFDGSVRVRVRVGARTTRQQKCAGDGEGVHNMRRGGKRSHTALCALQQGQRSAGGTDRDNGDTRGGCDA